jgi:hypothetical protein
MTTRTRGLTAFALLMAGTLANAGPFNGDAQAQKDPQVQGAKLELQYRHDGASAAGRIKSMQGNALEMAIAKAGRTSWYDHGIQASIDAVAECQRGDHPGGGMGLFSIATMRPSSPSDHCRRL